CRRDVYAGSAPNPAVHSRQKRDSSGQYKGAIMDITGNFRRNNFENSTHRVDHLPDNRIDRLLYGKVRHFSVGGPAFGRRLRLCDPLAFVGGFGGGAYRHLERLSGTLANEHPVLLFDISPYSQIHVEAANSDVRGMDYPRVGNDCDRGCPSADVDNH